ncbi:hypothetical protein J6590_016210 [Homalodisca vitripennis]|nr:hypothetical protein J6590_016210 [Homalodisca vitripennis]
MPNPMNHRYYYVMMGDFIINVLDNCHQSRRPRVTGQDSNKSDSNDTISCDSVPNASVSVSLILLTMYIAPSQIRPMAFERISLYNS